MSELHEVSRVIGQLEQAVKDGASSREHLRREMGELRQESADNHKCLEDKLDAVLKALPPLVGDVNWMKPHVRDYARWRRRIIAFLFVITGLAGLVGVGGKEVGAAVARLLG